MREDQDKDLCRLSFTMDRIWIVQNFVIIEEGTCGNFAVGLTDSRRDERACISTSRCNENVEVLKLSYG